MFKIVAYTDMNNFIVYTKPKNNRQKHTYSPSVHMNLALISLLVLQLVTCVATTIDTQHPDKYTCGLCLGVLCLDV